MSEQPRGTVSFLFSDIEGSTQLLAELGTARYAAVLERHRDVLRAAFAGFGGYEVDCEGDAFFVAFPSARAAVAAAAAAQRALAAGAWLDDRQPRVRMGIHTGEALVSPPKYVGLDVHRAARIMAAAHGGQVLLSQTTRELVSEELPGGVELRDLGQHRLKDLAGTPQLHQLVIDGIENDHPPPRTLAPQATNLPVPPVRLVGRLRELDELIDRLLRDRQRLLTLIGEGGAGKTRLALAAAAAVEEAFADGAWFVDLAPLSDPAQVVPAIASAVRLPQRASEPLAPALERFLADRQQLLVVDNFEHVLDAAAHVTDILAAAPRVQVLATSRAPLRLSGEQRYPVGGLAERDAAALFYERARAVRPDLERSDASDAAVTALSSRLGGLPLAIELAAGRSALLSLDDLARRLDQGLSLLTGGPRDAPPRQRTLRATIDWSFGLLDPEEQALLTRLGVFAGDFSLDAVESICGGDGVLDALASLVESSLVRRHDRAAGPRFSLHASIREYAVEQQQARGDERPLRRAHAAYYAALAERWDDAFYVESDFDTLRCCFDAEYDDMRAALAWARTSDARILELGLAAHLALHRMLVGHMRESKDALEHALSRDEGRTDGQRARAVALGALSAIEGESGRYAAAEVLCEQAMKVWQELGDELGVAAELSRLGEIAYWRGDQERARTLLQEATERERRLGNPRRLCNALNDEASCAHERGELAAARRAIDEAIEIARSAGVTLVVMYLATSAELALAEGDVERARRDMTEAISRTRELSWPHFVAHDLTIYAAVAARRDEPRLAATLLGAAHELRTGSGFLQPSERRYRDEAQQRARVALGEHGFRTCFEAGEQMGPERAAALVVDQPLSGG